MTAIGFWRAARVHLVKDLRLEWRQKDALNAMLFFALLVVILFSLAFDPTREATRQIGGGVLAVAILFAATHALGAVWGRELQHGVLEAQRLAPAPLAALFAGKVVANFLFVSAVELVLAPLFAVFYNVHALGQAWWLAAIVPLGSWALVLNGVFFAAVSARTRARHTMLPLLLFPIFVPALVAMASGAAALLTGENEPDLWVELLAGYDILFTGAALLLFETAVRAED
jgi:heme exporter protein B